MKRLYFVWWQSVWRRKSLHVLGSRRWFFLIGVLQTTVHYPVFILTVCINEVNKQSPLKEDCKLCLLAGLQSFSSSVNDRKWINKNMGINLLSYYQGKMPNITLVPAFQIWSDCKLKTVQNILCKDKYNFLNLLPYENGDLVNYSLLGWETVLSSALCGFQLNADM